MCIFVVTTINGKEDMKLNESKWVGREEREGGKSIIIIPIVFMI